MAQHLLDITKLNNNIFFLLQNKKLLNNGIHIPRVKCIVISFTYPLFPIILPLTCQYLHVENLFWLNYDDSKFSEIKHLSLKNFDCCFTTNNKIINKAIVLNDIGQKSVNVNNFIIEDITKSSLEIFKGVISNLTNNNANIIIKTSCWWLNAGDFFEKWNNDLNFINIIKNYSLYFTFLELNIGHDIEFELLCSTLASIKLVNDKLKHLTLYFCDEFDQNLPTIWNNNNKNNSNNNNNNQICNFLGFKNLESFHLATVSMNMQQLYDFIKKINDVNAIKIKKLHNELLKYSLYIKIIGIQIVEYDIEYDEHDDYAVQNQEDFLLFLRKICFQLKVSIENLCLKKFKIEWKLFAQQTKAWKNYIKFINQDMMSIYFEKKHKVKLNLIYDHNKSFWSLSLQMGNEKVLYQNENYLKKNIIKV